jgi:hypothetical protein
MKHPNVLGSLDSRFHGFQMIIRWGLTTIEIRYN